MNTGSQIRSTWRTRQKLPRLGPGREMRRIHDMLDRVMGDQWTGTSQWYEGMAPIDVYQTDDEIVVERRYTSFARSITLPSSVNADKAEAEFENGILSLHIPKAEQAKPRQISVKAKK